MKGFNVESIQYQNVNLTVWDIGGQDKIRVLWKHYYMNTAGFIFVIDSNDQERLDEAAMELTKALKEPDLRDTKLLIFANKQDMPNAMKPEEITKALKLHDLRTHKWHIQGCCATSGEGLYEGLDWLVSAIKNDV
eukprot:TRINITY_DN3139_c0_g1_i6.p1 TRINITY_DN3139_c0_g1~~TRINITY_DN3139_c0_g1_i6.p1  ORF type:complete len:135 (+),score=23.93 TRINITY_DN3139_c0_g1_i6:472-876(+)